MRRRTFVLGGLAVAAAAVPAPLVRAAWGYPFRLGVARVYLPRESSVQATARWVVLARKPTRS